MATYSEIYSSHDKPWENLIYVQDEKKTSDWNTRHACLSKYGNKVYLLFYVTRPPKGKVKECWTLHRAVVGLDPWGFSKAGESDKLDEDLIVCIQTKDPEAFKFISMMKESDVTEFTGHVNSLLGRKMKMTRAVTMPVRNKSPNRQADSLSRSKSAMPGLGQHIGNADSLSLRHLGGASSTTSSQAGDFCLDPAYQGGGDIPEEQYEEIIE